MTSDGIINTENTTDALSDGTASIKTKGGLYKPESNKEQMKGEVLAVGSGIFTTTGTEIPMKLKVGDMVIVPNTGIQLKLDGEKLNLYREQEILMKIN